VRSELANHMGVGFPADVLAATHAAAAAGGGGCDCHKFAHVMMYAREW
jgi:hypothetical protein